MTILLLAEHTNSDLHAATAKALTAAKALGGMFTCSSRATASAAAEAAARLEGVAKVLVADAPHLEHALAEEIAALIVPLWRLRRLVAPATTLRQERRCRASPPLLDVMQISDITKVVSADTFERPIYAGNAIQTVQSHGGEEGHHRAHLGLPAGGRGRLGCRRDDRGAAGGRPVGLRPG